MIKSPLLLCAAALLGLGVGMTDAVEPLPVGSSEIVRQQVSMAVHAPSTLEGAHGPAGVLVFFGGVGDSTAYYQKAFAPLADALDLVVIVPQMPWFKEPGKTPPRGVYGALKQAVNEIEKQFQTDPRFVIVGGASAGGAPAHELTKQWSQKVPLFLLASTGPFPDIAKPRTFHVVAEKEVSRLGPQGRTGIALGKGKKDLFAIPGGSHSAQIKHLSTWLETEVAVLRLEQAQETIRKAEEKLRSKENDQARAILASTLAAVRILDQPVAEGDDYFKYEAKRRQELKAKFAPTIKLLEAAEAKLAEL
jgi:hypothetical protein